MKKQFQTMAFTPPPNKYIKIGDQITEGEDFRTLERYVEYKNCGFDIILFAGEDKYFGEDYQTSDLKMMLDLAEKANLKAIVFDERIMELTVNSKTSIINERFGGDSDKFKSFVGECMKEYKLHPAFSGVSILDEPFIGKVGVVKEITDAIHGIDKNATVHTCFLPWIQDMGMAENALPKGYDSPSDAYAKYIDDFTATGIGYYAYDAYPFGMYENKNVMTPGYIRNMQQVALHSVKNKVPFIMCIQSFSSGEHDDYRRVDESDLNWQSHLALSFGCKGLWYYTYWRFTTQGNKFSQPFAVMDHDGSKMLYEETQRNNALSKRLFDFLQDYEYSSSQVLTAPHDNPSMKGVVETDLGLVESYTATAPVLINKMTGKNGDLYAFINLRDSFEKEINQISIKLKAPAQNLSVLVNGYKMTIRCEDGWLNFNLAPGEGLYLIQDKK